MPLTLQEKEALATEAEDIEKLTDKEAEYYEKSECPPLMTTSASHRLLALA